jgi:Rieske Fe-S protein
MSDDQVVTGLGRQTRRTLLAGAGAVGAAVVLTACGTDTSADTVGAPAGNAPADGATGGAPAASNVLTKTADVPVGGGAIFAEKGVVVTQPTAGDFKAFSAICTHQGCPVASVDGGTINCTCHGSRYSIADGSVKNGPATKALAPKNIKVEGDNITLS